MVGEEILVEIDETLDQLIQNAEALQGANIQDLSETEIEAFQKTQESLLHHFLHMDKLWDTKKKSLKVVDKRSVQGKIKEKYTKFERLKTACHQTIEENTQPKVSLLMKRRTKKRICLQERK